MVVGRHSGTHMIQHVMETVGVTLDKEKSETLLAAVRTESMRKKTNLSAADLARLYRRTLD